MKMFETNSELNPEFYLFDSELRSVHELALPPVESYLFFPTKKQRIVPHKDYRKTVRRIFEIDEADYEEFELDKLKDLLQLVEKTNPSGKKQENWEGFALLPRHELLRFLQATMYDLKETCKIIKDKLEWQRTNLPLQMTNKALDLLMSGFLYVHGRDSEYRPIVVINADILSQRKKDFTYNNMLTAVVFFMEYLVNKLLIPGQVENWSIITNLENVGISPPSELKPIMKVLQSNYRCRLYLNYIVGMNWFTRGLFKIFTSFLNEAGKKKLKILADSERDKILELVNPEQVERRFGGKAEDVVPGRTRCFPPIMPSRNFLLENQSKSQVLVSEEEYRKRYKENNLRVVSKTFVDKWADEEKAAEIKGNLEIERRVDKTQGRKHDLMKTELSIMSVDELELDVQREFTKFTKEQLDNLAKLGQKPKILLKKGNFYNSTESIALIDAIESEGKSLQVDQEEQEDQTGLNFKRVRAIPPKCESKETALESQSVEGMCSCVIF